MIIYMHIPKTAGTTIVDALKLNNKASSLFIDYSLDYSQTSSLLSKYSRLSEKRKKNIQYVIGHIGFDETLFPNANWVTTLREPTERVISNYRHLKRSDNHQVDVKELSLRQFVESHMWRDADNGLVRRLSGCDQGPSGPRAIGTLTEADLGSAMDNLKKFSFVGLNEKFQLDVDHYCNALKCSIPRNRISNKAPNWQSNQVVDDSTYQIIKTANNLDIQLYEFALGLGSAVSVPHDTSSISSEWLSSDINCIKRKNFIRRIRGGFCNVFPNQNIVDRY